MEKEDKNSKTQSINEIIAKTNCEIELEKEKKLVNLIADMIVSITLKEFYEL